ncbi:MAG TPA: LON peptidase substrate-binding domain-containing protein [Alphaproteobacteria bacterium]|nr:LON peptidase substrate-binding domain-containing protein [Alphaproteobacteria bacterium]
MESKWRGARALPELIPVFPLARVILLPHGQLPLNVFEPRYLAMVDDAFRAQRLIGIVQPLIEEAAKPDLYKIGGIGRITSFAEVENRYHITLTGISRFEVLRELPVTTPYRQVQVSYEGFTSDRSFEDHESSIDRPALLKALRRYFSVNKIDSDWESIERAPGEALVNSLSMIAPVEPAEKQALLEAPTVGERARILIALIELSLADAAPSSNHKLN